MSLPATTVFYLDTRALVKRYITEIGSGWTVALCDIAAGYTIATAQITKVEAAAAFASKRRNNDLSAANYTAILQDLAHDFAWQYLLVEIDQSLVDLAVDLTKHQKLRGYDAIQLAAALRLSHILSKTSVTFIAADANLLQSA